MTTEKANCMSLRPLHAALLPLIFAATAIPAQPAQAATTITAVGSGQCLQASGEGGAAGSQIVQSPCTGAAAQQWSLALIGNYYHLVNKKSGLCLNVPGSSTSQGTQLIQYRCQDNSLTNDQWSITAADNASQLVSRISQQCVNISQDSRSDGAAVIQWSCQGQGAGSLNDKFYVSLPNDTRARPSSWSEVVTLPVNPIAVANLPDGKLLMWSADQTYSFAGDLGQNLSQTYTAIFDPSTLTSTQVVETNPGADMFCPGTTVLPDGRVLVNGGSSSPKTTIYDPNSSTWSASGDMQIPRGYEANTLLSDGNVFTFGGSWSGGNGGKYGEVWSSNSGTWAKLSGVPTDNAVVGPDPQGIYRGDNHMWLFAVASGQVFQAGPSATMNWIDTAGNGSIRSAGNRADDSYSINGVAVMYDTGKILKAGGATLYGGQGNTSQYANNAAYLIDISAGPKAPVQVQKLASMAYQRSFASGVALPDGSVLVVGGQSIPEPFTDTTAVLVPELWNPVTHVFQKLNPMQIPRTYHSTAILLPDARVFVGGGGQCGDNCARNHFNAEILIPPYLLNADGSAAARPMITAAPAKAGVGTTIQVATQEPVASFALMRLSAITHTVNNDQRRIPLTATVSGNSNNYSLQIPGDYGVVLPGYYMLFALNAAGVPSISKTILLQ